VLRYLLDTNVVSEPARPNPAPAVVDRMRTRASEIALPAPAWHELVYGVERMDRGRRRAYLARYLREVVRPSMPILPYDSRAARWHGQARARLGAQGRPTPFVDGQIAAIARVRGLILVTRNTDDFEPFQRISRDSDSGGSDLSDEERSDEERFGEEASARIPIGAGEGEDRPGPLHVENWFEEGP
jgi:tRNA(fMet)-specific endonuclease VapC